jgi:OFA family oxalate/formate antiporter-like MFS transporter
MVAEGRARAPAPGRWWQLALGMLALIMVANLQYSWTLFVNPLRAAHDWSLVAVQWAFTLCVLAETWSAPFEGYLADRFGPRLMVSVGGILVGASWVGASFADSLPLLYLAYAIGGLGVGIVYSTLVGNTLKWFPDRRGLCVGLTAGSYGAGTALTIVPIQHVIESNGYAAAFLWFGLLQGIVVFLVGFFVSAPPRGWRPAGWDPAANAPAVRQSGEDFTTRQMLGTRHFWLLYVMFTMVATGGLMATAQLGPIAQHYGVDRVVLIGGFTALTLAMQIDRLLNGVTRPLWGWLSDHIGRERSMALAFGSEAVAILVLVSLARHPLLFVVFSGLAFFSWGEIFSLFPTLATDFFGRQHATGNYGLLYTAKGVASLLAGPAAALLVQYLGTWAPVFYVAAAFDTTAALLAILVLRRMALPSLPTAPQPARPAPLGGGSG